MGRHRHDGACAVAHQYIIGNINGNLLAVYRIHRRHAVDTHTGLFLGKLRPFKIGFSGGLLSVSADLVPILQLVLIFVNDGMLRGYHHVGRPEQGIAAGGVNAQLILLILNGKVHLRAHGLADPILLGHLDTLHIVHRVKPLDQLVRILRNF